MSACRVSFEFYFFFPVQLFVILLISLQTISIFCLNLIEYNPGQSGGNRMILISWSSPVYDADWKFQSSPPIPPLLKLKFASLHLQRLKINLLLNLLVCFISLRLTSIRSQEFVVLSMQFSYLA